MAHMKESLRQLRQERGLTQEEVAEQVGLTRQAVSSYESGRTRPSMEILERLAEIYQVELTDIIYGKNTRKGKNAGNTLPNRRVKVLRLVQLITFIAALVYIVLIPSTPQPSVASILLLQIRLFFAVPLCISSLAGLAFTTINAQLIRTPARWTYLPRILLFAALAVLISGVYWCIGFVLFQIFPPLPFKSGLFVMEHRWIVSVWWCAASLLFSLFAALAPPQSKVFPR